MIEDIVYCKDNLGRVIENTFEPIFRDFASCGKFFIAGGAVVEEIEKFLQIEQKHRAKDVDLFCSSKSVFDQFSNCFDEIKYENKNCRAFDEIYDGRYIEVIKRGYPKTIEECLNSFDLVHCAAGIDPKKGLFLHKDTLDCIKNRKIQFNAIGAKSRWEKTILRCSKYFRNGYSMDAEEQKFFINRIIDEGNLFEKFKKEMYGEDLPSPALVYQEMSEKFKDEIHIAPDAIIVNNNKSKNPFTRSLQEFLNDLDS